MTDFLKNIWTLLIKKIPLFVAIIFLSSVVGLFFLSFNFFLFSKVPDYFIAKSAKDFEGVGSRQVLFSWCTSELDNWTDALILQISADNTEDSPLNRALLAYHGANLEGDGSPVDSIKSHYLEGRAYDLTDIYPKYWHGYLLLIRPLLHIMSYSGIRILNGIFQLIINCFIVFLFFRKKLSNLIFPYVLSLLMLMPITQAMSMQFSSCFYIFSFGIIAILLCEKIEYYPFIFLLIGIATAYFDFLTYPIVTLGMPAIVAIFFSKNNKLSEIPIYSGSWLLGYGGMWSSKWLLTELLSSVSIISDVRATLLWRTSSSAPDVSLTAFSVIRENLSAFFHTPITFVLLTYLLVILACFLVNKKYLRTFCYKRIICLFLIAILPLLWFAFTQNHSYIHSFYTNKGCVVFVFALSVSLSTLIRKRES